LKGGPAILDGLQPTLAVGDSRWQEIAMSFYRDHIYPHLISRLGNPPPIRKIRQWIIPWAQGKVLEIGVGSGANFVHYDPAKVSKLYALEPNPGMIRLADKQRRLTTLDVEFLDLPGEHIPLADGTVDTVVSTFTLCTIPGVVEAIGGIARALKPGGKLIFFELGLAPDPRVRRWQVRLEAIYRWLFQGLYLTRDIPALIRQGGFGIEQMGAAYIAGFPKSASYCWWGTAIPHSLTVVLHDKVV
jgi:SAM-dependent methyltransferase